MPGYEGGRLMRPYHLLDAKGNFVLSIVYVVVPAGRQVKSRSGGKKSLGLGVLSLECLWYI